MRLPVRPVVRNVSAHLRSAQRPYSSAGLSKFITISEEVRAALAAKRPVVALESAVYTHGFPVPQNLELAHAMEHAVRSNGATPATICILNGRAYVGLTPSQIEEMTDSAGKPNTVKVSRRDLPFVTGIPFSNPGVNFIGGTTIAGTSILAQLAGIKVFATGGLGGVHRGVEKTMDVSADLTELGRTNVAVISSGSKAFLDLHKTLEYLETEGVYVGTFGSRSAPEPVQLPAFYSQGCGIISPSVVESAEEAAGIIYASHNLGLTSGQLFCNPIPKEFEIPHEDISTIIADAVRDAEGKATGKDVTPFILADILKRTNGKSIHCNRALLVNNAAMGGRVAKALSKLEREAGLSISTAMPHMPNPSSPISPITKPAPASPPQVLVIGGLALDTTITPTSPIALHTSNPARITSTPGGVAHNLHLALTRSSIRSHLITALGTDPAGATLVSLLPGTSTLLPSPLSSAQYISLNTPTGSLYTAAADMDIISSTLTPAALTPILSTHSSTPYILADANIPGETLHHIISHCRTTGQKLIFEPTSTAKTPRILPPKTSAPLPLLHAAAPNSIELTTLWETAKGRGWFDTPAWFKLIDELQLGADFRERINNMRLPPCITDEGLVQKAIQCLPLCDNLWVKLGGDGCLVTRVLRTRGEWEVACEEDGVAWWGQGVGVHVVWYKAEVPGEVVSVNGAGDTFLGVLVAGEVRQMGLGERVRTAQRAAVETLRVVGSVGDVEKVWRE